MGGTDGAGGERARVKRIRVDNLRKGGTEAGRAGGVLTAGPGGHTGFPRPDAALLIRSRPPAGPA